MQDYYLHRPPNEQGTRVVLTEQKRVLLVGADLGDLRENHSLFEGQQQQQRQKPLTAFWNSIDLGG